MLIHLHSWKLSASTFKIIQFFLHSLQALELLLFELYDSKRVYQTIMLGSIQESILLNLFKVYIVLT